MNKATNSQNGKNAVDVSKLFNGKEYKNYSELAKEMGWRLYKSGSNGQNLQFKRLSEVCRWGRDVDENGVRRSYKIIIHEVYPEPIPALDRRVFNENTTTSLMALCGLLDVLLKRKNTSLTIGRYELYHQIGCVSKDYLKIQKRLPEVAEKLDVSYFHLFDVIDTHQDLLKHMIEKISSLGENLGLFTYSKVLLLSFDGVKHKVVATQKQTAFIEAMEKEWVSNKLYPELFSSRWNGFRQRQTFYNRLVSVVNKKVKNSNDVELLMLSSLKSFGWHYHFDFPLKNEISDYISHKESRGLTLAQKNYLDYLQNVSGGFKDLQNKIKATFTDKVKENAKLRKEKALLKPSQRALDYNRLDDDYLSNCFKIIDYLANGD